MKPEIRGPGAPGSLVANKGEFYLNESNGDIWVNRDGTTNWFNLSGQSGSGSLPAGVILIAAQAHDTVNHEPPYYAVAYIMKT